MKNNTRRIPSRRLKDLTVEERRHLRRLVRHYPVNFHSSFYGSPESTCSCWLISTITTSVSFTSFGLSSPSWFQPQFFSWQVLSSWFPFSLGSLQWYMEIRYLHSRNMFLSFRDSDPNSIGKWRARFLSRLICSLLYSSSICYSVATLSLRRQKTASSY